MSPALSLILEVLNAAATAADAAAKTKAAYQKVRAAYQQSKELTPEEDAQLDARAAEIFASEASKPSGR